MHESQSAAVHAGREEKGEKGVFERHVNFVVGGYLSRCFRVASPLLIFLLFVSSFLRLFVSLSPPSPRLLFLHSSAAHVERELKKHGAVGIVGLGRKFRIMDDDGSNSLQFSEFKKATAVLTVELSATQVIHLFIGLLLMNLYM